MAFQYEVREDQDGRYAELTGYEGTVSVLRVPEEIGQLPVRSIAGNAFSWRSDLTEAILPERLRTIRGFAFYNCPNLKKIRLYDGIEDYYDGVIRHCRSLSEIRICMQQDHFGLVKAMLADNDRCLRIELRMQEETVRLTFPEYFSDYIEDTRARAFHTKIEGAGYRYRACVTARELKIQEYDEIFVRAISDDPKAAAQIALDRLQFPYYLEKTAKDRYEEYLRMEMQQILPERIRAEDTDTIDFLAKQELISEEALKAGLRIASEKNLPVICARLMDAQRQVRGERQEFSL